MFAVAAEELIAFLWANSTTFGCEGSENCSRFLLDNYTLLYQVEQVRVKHALEFRAESKQGTRLPINGSPCFFQIAMHQHGLSANFDLCAELLDSTNHQLDHHTFTASRRGCTT